VKHALGRIAVFPAGRVGKWVVLAAWILLIVALSPLGSRFEGAQENEPSSFLPGDAESVLVLDQLDRFPSGEAIPAVVVAQRDGGLTPADRAALAEATARFNRDLPEGVEAPGLLAPQVSPDGTAAIAVASIRAGGESDLILDAVDELRAVLEPVATGGLRVEVTGPAGFSADAIEVFGGINTTLLLATALLVFVLLIIIYRSPIFWILPLLAVAFAEVTARALGYLMASNGITVNGQTAGILLVLVFGAGTDYALLLTARYREELRRHEDRHEAMAIAIRRAGPAIVASAATVIAALLVLLVAEVNGTSGLGPVGAMGVAVAMIVMMTALPALLVIGGRVAFWPFIPRYGSEAGDETRGWWRRVGDRVARRPRRVWIGTTAALVVACFGLAGLDSNLTSANDFRDEVGSVRGQELISSAFPGGSAAPTTVVVGDAARAPQVVRALEAAPGVAAVREVERDPQAGVRLDVTLEEEPYSTAAYARIPELRDVVREAGGPTALVGGPTAEEADFRESARRDNLVIPPLVLLVVFLILALLLRALLAPLVLIGTVILSFLAALGFSVVAFDLVDFPGESPTLPLFGFIFLVALGVDYNIFLMARVREEAQAHGTREGMLRGLAVTGGVITSAGVVLAGTFLVLGVLPLVTLTEIGFLVAFGVLLDTLVVRSILVPAITLDMGDRIWWPSALWRRSRQEAPAAEPAPDPT
jgi:RND superfamily putative drug exporter